MKNLWHKAYNNWKEDCREEFNIRYPNLKTTFTEFSEEGAAYPHGIGGVKYIKEAVTPWLKSKHYLP